MNNHAPIDAATAPKRIQRKRTKGWRMPENTVSVTRPGRWGNPFYPGSGLAMGGFNDKMEMVNPPPTPANCVAWFRKHMEIAPDRIEAARNQLRGKNLACWCALDQPCHADVLLEIAND